MNSDPLKDVFLYHYYEAMVGPFRSLSSLGDQEAEAVLARLRAAGTTFAAKRAPDYWSMRRTIERRLRTLFEEAGGKPVLMHPHYLIVGPCPWLRGWYRDGQAIKVPLPAVDPHVVSFTYGDSFPAMRFQDGKPYRGCVYTKDTLLDVITTYGWPQQWNVSGAFGPERYIEAQVWDEVATNRFIYEL